ncbi:MAG: L-histidine N(alpha)-methyltransferase, partial [Steroidobacteraceae bacterium]
MRRTATHAREPRAGEPREDRLTAGVLRGLAGCPKRLSPTYLYDARGSALFERICEQPEYYLTRTELA